MAHYSFHKDLEQSKVAVDVVKTYLEKYYDKKLSSIRDASKEEQIYGDVCATITKGSSTYESWHEVKFDIKSEETGNLCFEIYNSKGVPTGILRTLAHEIDYVTVRNGKYVIFRFDAAELRKEIFDPYNWEMSRLVSGGDRSSYKMLLVKEDVARKWGTVVEIENA